MYFKPDKKIVLDIIININKCDVMIVNIEVLTICRYRREYEKDGCENQFIGVTVYNLKNKEYDELKHV